MGTGLGLDWIDRTRDGRGEEVSLSFGEIRYMVVLHHVLQVSLSIAFEGNCSLVRLKLLLCWTVLQIRGREEREPTNQVERRRT
jgi:hypothetical protein